MAIDKMEPLDTPWRYFTSRHVDEKDRPITFIKSQDT